MAMLFTEDRARLSGMIISGDGTKMYNDSSHKQICFWQYAYADTDVCNSVIQIPFDNVPVRYLKIETANYLTLCEVEVYVGKF